MERGLWQSADRINQPFDNSMLRTLQTTVYLDSLCMAVYFLFFAYFWVIIVSCAYGALGWESRVLTREKVSLKQRAALVLLFVLCSHFLNEPFLVFLFACSYDSCSVLLHPRAQCLLCCLVVFHICGIRFESKKKRIWRRLPKNRISDPHKNDSWSLKGLWVSENRKREWKRNILRGRRKNIALFP